MHFDEVRGLFRATSRYLKAPYSSRIDILSSEEDLINLRMVLVQS